MRFLIIVVAASLCFLTTTAEASAWKRKRMRSVCDKFLAKKEMAKIFDKKFIDNAGNPNYHTKYGSPDGHFYGIAGCSYKTSQPGQQDYGFFSFDILRDYKKIKANRGPRPLIDYALKNTKPKWLKAKKGLAASPTGYYEVVEPGAQEPSHFILVNASTGLFVQLHTFKQAQAARLAPLVNRRLLAHIKKNPQFAVKKEKPKKK